MAKHPSFIVEQRSEFCFAVLGPNPNFGKSCVSYAGEYLTFCVTDGCDEADLTAAALNAYPHLSLAGAFSSHAQDRARSRQNSAA